MTRTIRPLLALVALTLALAASPPAHAGALTDHAENHIVDAFIRGQTASFPATWHIGLSTAVCNDATPGAEPSGNGYARVAVAASLANWAGTQSAGSTTASSGTGGTTSNNAMIEFPESTGAWGTLQSVQWWDAASGGNRWICIDLATAWEIGQAGITVRFGAGQLQFQIDD